MVFVRRDGSALHTDAADEEPEGQGDVDRLDGSAER